MNNDINFLNIGHNIRSQILKTIFDCMPQLFS